MEEEEALSSITQLMTQARYSTDTWHIKDGEVWLYGSIYVGTIDEVQKMTIDEIVAIDEDYLHHRFE